MQGLSDTQPGRPLWARIAGELGRAILGGTFPAGSRLPNERDLMAMYRVSRNTLRRAVAELEAHGLLRTEQGRGSFVHERIDYALGARTRLTDNLAGTGLTAERKLLALRRTEATGEVAEALGLAPREAVWQVEGLRSIGGAEINIGSSWYPAARFPDFDQRCRATESITEILRGYGIADYLRAWTRIIARRATEAEARALRQPAASPVFDIRKLDTLPDGTPVAFGCAVWAADRVQFHVPGPSGSTGGSTIA